MSKQLYFMQFSLVWLQFNSIRPIDSTLSCATTLGQSEFGTNGNEEVLHIPQSSSITGTSLSDCFMYIQDTRGWGSYPSAKKQSAYSTAPADWAKLLFSKDYY